MVVLGLLNKRFRGLESSVYGNTRILGSFDSPATTRRGLELCLGFERGDSFFKANLIYEISFSKY